MKKLLLAGSAVLALSASAHASGWEAYYDCGNGVVPIFGGWHGKTWLSVEANHKVILDERMFQNAGIAINEKPEPLNADLTDFRFPVKWRGKKMILRYRKFEEKDNEVSFGGHACRPMGDSRYDSEAKRVRMQEAVIIYRGLNTYLIDQMLPLQIGQMRSLFVVS
jgi:hypothetical protein